MRRSCVLAAIGLCVALGTAAGCPTAGASSALVHVGSIARLPAGAHTAGALPPSSVLDLAIALEPRDANRLRRLATEVSTPGSPRFHRFLSRSAFSRRFGARRGTIAALTHALRASGLSVGLPTANHLLLPVRGTAAEIERAFSLSLSRIVLSNGARAFADLDTPRLPRALAADVQGIIGLDDLARPSASEMTASVPAAFGPGATSGPSEPEARAASPGPHPCAAALSEQQTLARDGVIAYTPDQIATAYGFSALYGTGDLGAGATIAIVGLTSFSPSDIQTYQSCYGTSASVSTVDVDGGASTSNPEAPLDIEQLIGLAPQASIIVYEGPDDTAGLADVLGQIVSADTAKVISSSYGACEQYVGSAQIAAENAMLEEAATQGQSFVAESGDAGSSACYASSESNTGLSVTDPASQPYATGVGATTLPSASQPASESLWNEASSATGAAASGGGISSHWPMPAYQSGAAPALGVIGPDSSGTPCGTTGYCREVPDVSADGDGRTAYDLYLEGAWTSIGGTSASTPLWASFIALVDASRACRGVRVGFANPALYAIASQNYSANFHDVTAPNPTTHATSNDILGTNGGLYPVTPGFDMTSGLGTPTGQMLARSLCAAESPIYAVGLSKPGKQVTTVGRRASLSLRGSDSGGVALTYSASGLPAGLRINPATGLISGTPVSAGTSTVTVTAQDGDTNQASVTFTWQIRLGSPTASGVSLKGLSAGRPKLALTVTAGAGTGGITLITIELPAGITVAKSGSALRRRIAVSDHGGPKPKYTISKGKGTVEVDFKRPVTRATISVVTPALAESKRLATEVRHHQAKRLKLQLLVGDLKSNVTSLTVKPAI
jgi:hypothetical protein